MNKALTLLIIRHAEKSDLASDGPGLSIGGAEDKESLTLRGWQRAGAWAALFGAGLGGADYPKPNAIYAATPGEPDRLGHGPSRRPWETASPAADRLQITINTKFAKGDEDSLVAELLGLEGVVLVAWEHKAIVENIIPRIPVNHGTPPTKWHGDRYDVVLRFDRPDGGEAFAYRPLYPQLMSDDKTTPVDA